ncbi:hypothetical protein LXL04_036689 [Taraxacum kok-saghyz]
MAPELFDNDGVHSYASDLWALGCVLYECYAGRPPFIGEKLKELVKSILIDPIPSLSGNPSPPFANLVVLVALKVPPTMSQNRSGRTGTFRGGHTFGARNGGRNYRCGGGRGGGSGDGGRWSRQQRALAGWDFGWFPPATVEQPRRWLASFTVHTNHQQFFFGPTFHSSPTGSLLFWPISAV